MDKLKIRCFWGAFYLILLLVSPPVCLVLLTLHTVFLPMGFKNWRRLQSRLILVSYCWPFVKHDKPRKFGLEGTRNFRLKFESTVDRCPIELGVWHTLPKSLVEKHRSVLDRGSDVLDKLYEDELKNSDHPVFLYLHGIFGTRAIAHRVELYKLLQNLDTHVVSFDYRGFGDSTDVLPMKIGLVEDILRVYEWILNHVGPDRPVFMWGHSMGSGMGQRAFSKLEIYSHSLLGLEKELPPPNGMVLEGSYNCNAELTRRYALGVIANWLPYLEKIMLDVMGSSRNNVAPQKYAGKLRWCPLLMLHSKDDMVIPYYYSNKLYEKHIEVRKDGGSPVTFVSFERGGHSDIYTHPTVPGLVQDFITKHKNKGSNGF